MVTQCNSAEVFTLNFSPHNIWWRDTSQTKYLGPVVSSQITNNITSPSWKENDGININVVLLLARWKLKWSSRPELLKINNWTRKRKQFSPWTFYLFEVVQMQRRQTTEISDDTDCGAWPQAGEVQTSTVQQDDILDTALCHHLRRFVHHLPTMWCAMEQSQFANIFSVLATFLFLSVVNIGAVWPWWPASCCQLSTQCQHRYRPSGGFIYLELFSVHLSFTIDEVQSMRLRMKIGFILINDFAERRWIGDVFFMLTLLPSIASVQPPAELTIMINAAAPLIHFVINTHIHTTLATRQYFIIINVQSRLGTRSADVCSSVDKITSSSILSLFSFNLFV